VLRPVNYYPLPHLRTPITLSEHLSNNLLALPLIMSHAQPTPVASGSGSSSGSNFQLIINNALDQYKRRTKNDLLAHPLVAQFRTCDSASAVLAILQQHVQALDQSRSNDERWLRWLDPVVNVLYSFSSTLGAGVGLVCFGSLSYPRSTVLFFSRRSSPQRM
jgi:hypothetical protein